MLSWIREKFGTVLVGLIIGFIAFVFIFYGVFSPKATQGLHEGAVAGTVNGEPITLSEFNRELNRKMEFFRNYGGGKITEEQLKSLGIRENVFQELVQWKLMIQEFKKQGLWVADEKVVEKIQSIPQFQKDGKFDLATYKSTLEFNHQIPANYEKLVREILSQQQWEDTLKDRIYISLEEAKKEFKLNEDKRKVQYVLLKAREKEKSEKKDQNKTLEAQQKYSKIADELIPLMKGGKVLGPPLKSFLKKNGFEIKTTPFLNRKNFYIPEVGESSELVWDAFSFQSSIDPKKNGKAKKYLIGGQVLVALLVEEQKPHFEDFEKQRESFIKQIAMRKYHVLFQEWIKKLVAQAKIEPNASVIGN